jgi:hypothetical protein
MEPRRDHKKYVLLILVICLFISTLLSHIYKENTRQAMEDKYKIVRLICFFSLMSSSNYGGGEFLLICKRREVIFEFSRPIVTIHLQRLTPNGIPIIIFIVLLILKILIIFFILKYNFNYFYNFSNFIIILFLFFILL